MDSQLVVGHMKGTFQVKNNQLLRYFHKANTLLKNFVNVNIVHVPREQNSRADFKSKLTHSKEKVQLSLVIRMALDKPVIKIFTINIVAPKAYWWQNVRELMKKQEQGEKVSTTYSKHIARFLCIGDDLYRWGYTTLLLKCLSEEEAITSCENFTMEYVVCIQENVFLGPEYYKQGITGQGWNMIMNHSSRSVYPVKNMAISLM